MTNPRQSASSAEKKRPVVLVTGASQGIGAAIARVFAAEVKGVRLALVARNAKNLRAVAAECATLLRGRGADVAVFPCDTSDERAVARMARAVTKRFGVVDVLINNAGKFLGAPFLQTKLADFDAQIAANLRSVFLVSQAFVPAMADRGRGDVFNMGSVASFKALPGMAAYGAAKFAVLGLSRVMREELKPHGVRVCCVMPGGTESPSWAGSGVAPERLMAAEDVARAFLDVWRFSRRTTVEEIILRPQLGDLA
ncbi:MAG: NAD(P)-dependent oxidoreductase [Opitutus sp.]|nr:NAD(P)-dependent oxidoreductase [Opitutus sp.]